MSVPTFLRQKPRFDTAYAPDTENSPGNELRTCLVTLISAIFSVFFGVAAFSPAIQEKAWGFALLCFLFAVMLGVQALVSFSAIEKMPPVMTAKDAWIENAVCIDVPIVERKAEYNEYAEFREDEYTCEFALRLPVEITHAPVEQVDWVNVSSSLYNKYSDQNSVVIYYSTDNPAMFLLAGE